MGHQTLRRLSKQVAAYERARRLEVPKILIVDDEHGMLSIVEYIRIVFKWEVDWVQDGQQALDWIAANGHPDVILLDLHMPVMSGWDFMERYDGPTRVIITSAWVGQKGLPMAIFGTAMKPLDMPALKEQMLQAAEAKDK